jgi:hypothetical protein
VEFHFFRELALEMAPAGHIYETSPATEDEFTGLTHRLSMGEYTGACEVSTSLIQEGFCTKDFFMRAS